LKLFHDKRFFLFFVCFDGFQFVGVSVLGGRHFSWNGAAAGVRVCFQTGGLFAVLIVNNLMMVVVVFLLTSSAKA
jgi:hypothetical protein